MASRGWTLSLVILLVCFAIGSTLEEGRGGDKGSKKMKLSEDKKNSASQRLNLRKDMEKLGLREEASDSAKLGGDGLSGDKEAGKDEQKRQGFAEQEAGSEGGKVCMLLRNAASLLPPVGMASSPLRAGLIRMSKAKIEAIHLPPSLSSAAPIALAAMVFASSTFITR